MNAIAKQFGVQHLMPLQTARFVVMRERTVRYVEPSVDEDENDHSSKPLKRSAQHPCHVVFKALRDNVDPYDYECDSDTEDEDYSNTSVEEEETSCSSESSSDDDCDVVSAEHRMVRFGTPLVTASYTRPVTTMEEKHELYYTEREYREFRRQFGRHTGSCGRSRRANHPPKTRTACVVQFHANVVTEIHETCQRDNTSELYYSRTELQGFLDEFVASLSPGV